MSINSPQAPQGTQVQQKRPTFAPSYNAVQINLDTPTLNAPAMPGYYYDYPQADGPVYYPPVQTPTQAPQPPVNTTPQVPQPQVEQPPQTAPAAPPAPPTPPSNDNSSVDIDKVVANLGNADFDVQADQMDEIAKKGMTNEADAVPYVQEDVFNKLIDIVDFDSSNLAKPTEQQMALRAKIAENDAMIAQAEQQGKDPKSVKLPHQLTADEEKLALTITPWEQAERNKEYALFTMAILQKTYGDEIEKRSGNVVPLTDLPGAAQVVNELKTNENPAIRTAAIDSLRYVQRPEYKDDLSKIYSIAQSDADETVSIAASEALKSLEQA